MQRYEMGGMKARPLCDKCIAYEAANPYDPFDEKESKRLKVRVADAAGRDSLEAPPLLGLGSYDNRSEAGESVVFTLKRLATELTMFPKQLKCFAIENGFCDAAKWTVDWEFSHTNVVQLRRVYRQVAGSSEYFHVPREYSIDPTHREILKCKGFRMYKLYNRIVTPQSQREQDFLEAMNLPTSHASELASIWSRFVGWCHE